MDGGGGEEVNAVSSFLLAVKKKERKKRNPRFKVLRDNGVISPIRISSGGLWVGCGTAHSCLFVLPHFINQPPVDPRNQLSRFADLFPCGNQGGRDQFTTFMPLPDIINHFFVFVLLLFSSCFLFLSVIFLLKICVPDANSDLY